MKKNKRLKEQIENSLKPYRDQKNILHTKIKNTNDEEERKMLLSLCKKYDDIIMETIHDLIDKHYPDQNIP